jgi:hypothetical protein
MDVQLQSDVNPRPAGLLAGSSTNVGFRKGLQETQEHCCCGERQVIVSEIRRNQIIRASASADIESCRGGTYQVTVAVECVQEPRFIGTDIWLNALERIRLYIE